MLEALFSSAITYLFYFLLFFVFIFVIAAIFPSVPRHLIYLHKIKADTWWAGGIQELSAVHSSVKLKTKDGHELGAWVVRDPTRDRERTGKTRKVVVIYFHGNAETRAQSRRKRLYPILRSYFHQSIEKHSYSNNNSSDLPLEVELLTFDYRGFGDSPGSPSEGGVIEDGRAAYFFAVQTLKADEVIFWGHSLGTGISTQTVLSILHDHQPPSSSSSSPSYPNLLKGLILEAPFRSIRWAALDHWAGLPIWFLPSFVIDKLFDFIPDKLDTEAGLIKVVNAGVGVCIIHGVDDMIIGQRQGKHLYNLLKEEQERGEKEREGGGEVGGDKKGFVMCHWFESVGHNGCCFHEEMGGVVERFVMGVM